MASGQTASLIVGNGDLYGIVWEKDGGLYLRITKNDIWDARIDTSKDGPLPKVNVRTRAMTGSTGAPPSYGYAFPQPRCAAALRLGTADAAAPSPGLRASLDLQHAVATISRANGERTDLRVLADRNVVLITTEQPVTIEEILAQTLPRAQTGNTDGVAWLRMTLPGDQDYKGMEYCVAVGGTGHTKVVSLVTSFDITTGDAREAAIALTRKTLMEVVRSREKLITKHEQAWTIF